MTSASPRTWRGVLQEYIDCNSLNGEIDSGRNVELCFRRILENLAKEEYEKQPSLKFLPRFYTDVEFQSEGRQLLRKISRRKHLQSLTQKMILSQEDLGKLEHLLTARATPPYGRRRDRINWEDFQAVGENMSADARQYFTAKTFLMFRRDALGRINTHLYFHYVCRCMALWQTRVQLSMYDATCSGYLREQYLENYIYALIPNMPALDLQENFYPFYVFTAVRKFFFFLDPKRTGRIAMKDVIVSPVLDELLQLQQQESTEDDYDNSNWFSAANALRVYSTYLELDVDHNGMLSKQELARYGRGSLTSLVIDRIFEECHTYDGEMDYKTFLDFVLAMEHKKSPQSLAYFFRLLDIKRVGYLDIFTINCFFREIVKRLAEEDSDVVTVEDVKDEIFDMCSPAHPHRITLDDLVNCQVGDTIVTMLTDLSGFWAYDNRESLIQEELMEEEDDAQPPRHPMDEFDGSGQRHEDSPVFMINTDDIDDALYCPEDDS